MAEQLQVAIIDVAQFQLMGVAQFRGEITSPVTVEVSNEINTLTKISGKVSIDIPEPISGETTIVNAVSIKSVDDLPLSIGLDKIDDLIAAVTNNSTEISFAQDATLPIDIQSLPKQEIEIKEAVKIILQDVEGGLSVNLPEQINVKASFDAPVQVNARVESGDVPVNITSDTVFKVQQVSSGVVGECSILYCLFYNYLTAREHSYIEYFESPKTLRDLALWIESKRTELEKKDNTQIVLKDFRVVNQ